MSGFWNADKIRFMRDACKTAPYHRELADWIAPQLAPGSRICDAGCGVGALALELAVRGFAVTAADADRLALDALAQDVRARGMGGGVRIRCGDIRAMQPETPYDAMVFSLFGQGEEILRIAKSQCRGPVFIVLRSDSVHRFSVNAHPVAHGGYAAMRALLDTRGIAYTAQERSIDFSQPLRDFEDARRFFACYSRDPEALITDAFLHSRVSQSGRDDFQLMVRQSRSVGLIRLNAADIPEDI